MSTPTPLQQALINTLTNQGIVLRLPNGTTATDGYALLEEGVLISAGHTLEQGLSNALALLDKKLARQDTLRLSKPMVEFRLDQAQKVLDLLTRGIRAGEFQLHGQGTLLFVSEQDRRATWCNFAPGEHWSWQYQPESAPLRDLIHRLADFVVAGKPLPADYFNTLTPAVLPKKMASNASCQAAAHQASVSGIQTEGRHYCIIDDFLMDLDREGFAVMDCDPHQVVGVVEKEFALLRDAVSFSEAQLNPGEPLFRVKLARRHGEHTATLMNPETATFPHLVGVPHYDLTHPNDTEAEAEEAVDRPRM